MHRPTMGHRSVARLIGLGLTVGFYVAVLLFAAQVTGAETAAPAPGGAVATTMLMAPAARSESLREAPGQGQESPILTLAIAGVGIATAGAWRLVRVPRRPRPMAMPAGARRTTTTT